jgi:hypothetical protein
MGTSGRKGTGDREGRSGPRTRVPAAIGGVLKRMRIRRNK